MWVKTCFLGKGLSPSKLSTKALCGDTRKEEGQLKRKPVQSNFVVLKKNREAGVLKAVRAPRSSVVTDLQQGTDDVGTFGKR